jgi:predicted signal transduction protein with EAL and GGDEF domain
MTPWAMPLATNCFRPSPSAWSAWYAAPTPLAARVETNLWFFSPKSNALQTPASPLAKYLTALAAPLSCDPYDLHVTASIGVSTYPEDGDDAETLMANADTAMYQAKEHSPSNYQFFKKHMNVRAIERRSVEAELNRALMRGEFTVHYQSKS